MAEVQSLTDYQRDQLRAFKDFAAIDDDGRAISFLRNAEWNVSIALERSFSNPLQEDGEEKADIFGSNAVPGVRSGSGDTLPHSPASPNSDDLEYTNDIWVEWFIKKFHYWRRYIEGFIPSFALPWLPTIFSDPPSAHYFQSPLERFRKKYGPLIPNFQARSLVSIMGQDTNRPIFIYLHSPGHDDTDDFCRDSLTNEEVVNYLNTKYISWLGSVATSKGYNIATRMLWVTRYPYIAVLSPLQGRRNATQFNAVFQHAGPIDAPTLLRALRTAQDKFQLELAQNVAHQMQLQEDRVLREQQENDYSNMIDEEKQRIIAKRAREEEQRLRRQKEEEEARTKREKVELKEAELDEARGVALSMLPDEPEEREAGVVRARIRLPDGSSRLRRFRETNFVEDVFNYVIYCEPREADSGEVVLEFTLVSTFPRLRLKRSDGRQTLKSLGLIQSMNLFVEPT